MEAYRNPRLTSDERAKDLLQRMTLCEKVGQLTQSLYGFRIYERHGEEIVLSDDFYREVERFGGIGAIYGLFRADPWAEKNFESGLDGALAIRTRNRIQACVISHSRLGIPVLFTSECPHGHQALDGYLLPVSLASASTFSPSLVEQAFEVCGKQMREMGVDLALVSVMDVLRDPRWGRSEETFGEDPYLASQMARAVVGGIRSQGVSVVAKHFCAQGETTGGINASAASIGERELREIHLPPARAAVSAGAESVMATYHEIDGVQCCANSKLLNDVLRYELGFEGVVMSDALAVNCLDSVTGDTATSAATALRAGVDMGLLDDAMERLIDAVAHGILKEDELDAAVLRVLKLKFDRGLFEHPYVEESTHWQSYTPDSEPIVRQLTEESVILLKNEHALLPLDSRKPLCIGITGPNADDVYAQMGDYTPPLRHGSCTTVLQGMRNYLKQMGKESQIVEVPFSAADHEDPIRAAKALEACDVVLAVLGGSSNRFSASRINQNGQVEVQSGMDCGEGVDSSTLALPGKQIELLRALKERGKTVVTLLICGRPYAMEEIDRYSDALLCGFYPGLCGGEVIPRLLYGDVAPGGRLPVSLPDRVGQIPVYYNYKQSYRAMRYRESVGAPRYSFGAGCTYTAFSYRALSDVHELDGTWSLQIAVRNEGGRTAHAVPQLYLKRLTGAVCARARQLCAFEKVCLAPQQETVLTLRIPTEAFVQVDLNLCERVVAGAFEWFVSDGGNDFLSGCFTFSTTK
ncbi:MAG: glycoside hydrolase family 3 C-terminal domain-containing protein [Clostridia bacterium]|nr:glycoside hydrolase family 3 C-terminal domain-containing protein [Clostridia bacterium]